REPNASARPASEPTAKNMPAHNWLDNLTTPGLREALEVLQKAEALPETTVQEQHDKAAILAVVRKNAFDLQQPPKAPDVTADDMALGYKHDAAVRAQQRLEIAARTDADLRAVLEEIASLRAEHIKLKQELE